MINKYYFINKFDTNNIDKLNKQTAVIYRNYNLETLNKEFILKFKKYCQKKGIKFYLSNWVKFMKFLQKISTKVICMPFWKLKNLSLVVMTN